MDGSSAIPREIGSLLSRLLFALIVTLAVLTPFTFFLEEMMGPIILVFFFALAVTIIGQALVSWMGSLIGHHFATRAPEEWHLDSTLGPTPDGFRCHKLAGKGVVPLWVTNVQIVGFLLRLAGGAIVIIIGAIFVTRWIIGS